MKIIEAVPHYPAADSFQFRVSLENLKQAVVARKWVVVFTTLATVALVVAYIWIWPPTYQVEVMIAADSEKDIQRNTFYNGWDIFRQQALADEAALMTSAPVLKETVRRLDLKYADVYHPFLSYIAYLWGESAVGKTYRKIKYWLFPKPRSAYDPTPEEIEHGKVLADFKEGVKLEQVKDANVGLLIVKASSQRVAEIANTVADVYLEQRRDEQVREAQQAQASLSEEVDKAQREIQGLDEQVAKFREGSGMLLQFEKDKVQIDQFQLQRQAVADLQAHIAESEDALRSINKSLAVEGEFMDSKRFFRDTAAQDRVTKLEMQLAQAKQLFQPTSPEVRDLEEQIQIAMGSIEGSSGPVVVRNAARVGDSYEVLRAKKLALEAQLAGDQAGLQQKEKELERMRGVLEQIPEKMKVNHDYERKQAVLEGKLQILYEKLTVATVSLATARSAPSALRIIEYADPPEQPVWPRPNLFIAAAIVFGSLLGVMAALLLELAFVRVSRYRLWEQDAEYRVFAVVHQDEKFLQALYPRPNEQKLLGESGQS
jgi:uncharacterized protein involved in exopolysaccharide biosynthesis